MRKFKIDYKLVHVNLMERHPKVQRDMREWHVRDLEKRYNELFVNPLTVAYTTTGANRRYWIIDGGHTHEASVRHGVESLWCKVINVHSYEEIAEIIIGMNKNKLAMSHADMHQIESDFRADSDSANIDRIFEVNGITRDDISAWGCVHETYRMLGPDDFMVLAALLSAVKDGGEVIDMPVIEALRRVVKKRSRFEIEGSEIGAVLEVEFTSIRYKAANTLRNKSLHSAPKALAHEIELAVFGWSNFEEVA